MPLMYSYVINVTEVGFLEKKHGEDVPSNDSEFTQSSHDSNHTTPGESQGGKSDTPDTYEQFVRTA